MTASLSKFPAEGRKLYESLIEGSGVTVCYMTDRRAATVASKTKTQGRYTVKVNLDDAELVSGSERTQDAQYKLTPNIYGDVKVFTLRTNGQLVEAGSGLHNGLSLVAGRHHYIDPNF